MNSIKMRILFILVSIFVTSLFFSNCTLKVSNPMILGDDSSSLSSQPPSNESDLIQGQKLYASNCTTCHGALEVSSKLGRTSDQISTAIATVGSMKFLSSLSSEDIRKISLALAPVSNPPGEDEPKMASAVEVRIGNRYLVQSNLQEVFVADTNLDKFDNSILQALQTNVTEHPEAFSGACTRYDQGCMPQICGLKNASCEDKLLVKSQATELATPNALRKGYMTRTCEEILAIDKAVNTALTKADIKTEAQSAPAVTKERIAAFLDFFYMNRPTSVDSANSLANLAVEAQSKGMNVLDQWRYVMLPVCESAAADLQ